METPITKLDSINCTYTPLELKKKSSFVLVFYKSKIQHLIWIYLPCKDLKWVGEGVKGSKRRTPPTLDKFELNEIHIT